jgi:hypothetical protein
VPAIAEPFAYATVAAMVGPLWTIADQTAVTLVPGWNAPSAVQIAGANKTIDYTLGFAGARTLVVQVAVKFASKYHTDKFLQLRESTNQIFALAIGDSGTVEARDRLDATVATLAATTIITNQWHYLELWIQQGIDARMQIRVDDVIVADLYNVDTNVIADMTTLSLGCERGGTTWSELVTKTALGGGDSAPSGSMTRIKPGWTDDVVHPPSVFLTKPVLVPPSALLEMVGLTRVRQPNGAPRPRQTIRLVGGQAVDDGALKATRWDVGQTEPLLVSIADDTNAFSPPNWASAEIVMIAPDGAQTIRGFDGLVSTFVKYLVNVGSSPITLVNNSSSTAPGNRIVTATGKNVSLLVGHGCWLVRHLSDARWRVLLSKIPAPTLEDSGGALLVIL